MSFSRYLSVLLTVLLAPVVSAESVTSTVAQQSELQLSPNKCIALRKGRECFASIEIKWFTTITGDYCLRREIDNMIINCWSGQTQGEFLYFFRSAEKENLQLVVKGTQRVVSQAQVKVSWVYKSRRKKGRWRIF